MKLKFEVDLRTNEMTADVSDFPTFVEQVEAMRLARGLAGMLYPQVRTLAIVKTPEPEPAAAALEQAA